MLCGQQCVCLFLVFFCDIFLQCVCVDVCVCLCWGVTFIEFLVDSISRRYKGQDFVIQNFGKCLFWGDEFLREGLRRKVDVVKDDLFRVIWLGMIFDCLEVRWVFRIYRVERWQRLQRYLRVQMGWLRIIYLSVYGFRVGSWLFFFFCF